MKASKAITISLASIIAACAIPFGTVFAADSLKDYPVETTDEISGEIVQPFERTLEIESITDYAVYGDNFAYASGLTITILSRDESGDRKCLPPYTHDYTVEKLDYDDKGNLYFENSSDISYLYASPPVRQEHEFQNIDSSLPIIIDTGYYALNSETGELLYYKNGVPTSLGNGFSLVKKYGEYVYAVKDGTVPYEIDEHKATPLDLSYTNFDEAKNILCGEAAKKLASGGDELKTANIERGKYYTQIDPNAIGTGDTDTFRPKSDVGSTKKAEADKPCLVLCKVGETAVVATNDGMFITSTRNLKKESNYSAPGNDWNSPGGKAYAIENTGVYSCPFMSESTKIAELESGAEHVVTVTEKFALDFINTKFYKVSYTRTDEDGKSVPVEGYVAANMLTPYDYKADDNKPQENGDKEFNYDTNVVSVVLAIVIVALVIVAIMYIALIGTKKDKNKKDKKDKKKKKDEPESESEPENDSVDDGDDE